MSFADYFFQVRFTGSGLSRFTEVMGPSGWGRLCFESITSYKEAHVMCREVSNEFAARYLPIKDSTYRRRSYTVQYKCTGEELHTSDCPRTFRLSSCVNYTRIDCTSGKQLYMHCIFRQATDNIKT